MDKNQPAYSKETAIKWYQKLQFPKECDEDFHKLLAEKELESIDQDNPVKYLVSRKDLGLNLLYFLTKCDEMKNAYESRGIPESYFMASAGEIVQEALYCKSLWGEIGVYEAAWINYVVEGKILFRIGRLNFLLETAGEWCEGEKICVGDPIVSVHIPGGTKLVYEDCSKAFSEAEQFIARYFPEHKYQYFICDSWLLYEGYDAFLGKESNIKRFRTFFEPYRTEESDIVIKFAFAKNITRENLEKYPARNAFQKKLKQYILAGEKLYVTFGRRKRSM